MTLTPIPENYTVRKDRFLYTLVGPDGESILSGIDEEACRKALYCLPEFGGTAYSHKIDSHVDL